MNATARAPSSTLCTSATSRKRRKQKKVCYEPELLYGREAVLTYQNDWIAGLVSADLPKRVDPGTWTLAGHVAQAGDHQQRVISSRE